jgi:SAM-dependent methyltransferase
MAPKGVADEGQLVARPPIHPASFDSLHPEKLNDIFLYYEDDQRTPSSKDKESDSTTTNTTKSAYRYKLTVVDRKLLPTTSNITYATAVFLIPAGRESEYMFTSLSALQQIATSAQTARLIAVSFGRGHQFVNTETVQQELTYVVQVLSRQGTFLPKSHSQLFAQAQQTEIPFLAMDGIGERNVIAQGETVLSGPYLVEQVRADDRMVRRLYFMDNPLVIQTEVALMSGESDSTNTSTVAIDAVIDKSHAAFDYHKQMAAGILALAGGDTTTESDSVSGLMVGLGGGGLVNFLQYLLALDTNDSASTATKDSTSTNHRLMAIELDPAVVQVAKQYFGVKVAPDDHGDDGGNGEKTTGVRIRVGNGLGVCAANDEHAATLADAISLPPESLTFLVIDVDSKDKTVGMSCPPVSFVETEYLQQISRLLKPDGVLAINVSARDPAMLQLVCQKVQTVFATVFLSQQDVDVDDEDRQDVNVALFALKETSELPSKSKLVERLEKFVPKERVDGVVFADLKESLDDLRLCNVDADASNSKNVSGKKTPKKNKKRGKRK